MSVYRYRGFVVALAAALAPASFACDKATSSASKTQTAAAAPSATSRAGAAVDFSKITPLPPITGTWVSPLVNKGTTLSFGSSSYGKTTPAAQ